MWGVQTGGGTSGDHPRQGGGASDWPGDIIPQKSKRWFAWNCQAVDLCVFFEFILWHIEFKSKWYDIVHWIQSIFMYTLIELAFQKRKFRHCCFCHAESCGEYAGSLLGVWRSRGFQSEVLVLEILSWLDIVEICCYCHWLPWVLIDVTRYGCACVVCFLCVIWLTVIVL